MWGFDSLKHNTVASDSHTKLIKFTCSDRLIDPWRETWKKLFQSEKVKEKHVFVHFDVQDVEKVV
jgi:hypothetical protein